jgi:hypothetical protein
VDVIALYLDLLKRSLTRLAFDSAPANVANESTTPAWTTAALRKRFGPAYVAIVRRLPFKKLLARGADRLRRTLEARLPIDYAARYEGRDWPASAETMIGMKRLDNLQTCIERVLQDEIPGDLIETGVWRGGATIFMRGVLAAHGVRDRLVFVADSFEGLPPPDVSRAPADAGDIHWTFANLAVSLDEVKRNFERYGLLDDRVRFLKGWFRDTLPLAPIERLAILRLDGDMYESTMDALDALYPKLSPGGYAIVDDYGAVEGCRRAVHDYRERNGIDEPIEAIDWTGVFWRKNGLRPAPD